MALVLLVSVGYWLASNVLRVETPNGTLIVEMDEDVEAKIKNGKVILSGPDGKDRYTLSAGERQKTIASGAYAIRVEGADGLSLNTPEFTLIKDGKVKVRVTMAPKVVAKVQLKKEPLKADAEPERKPKDKEITSEAKGVPADGLRRSDIPADVLSFVGGGDPTRAPPDLVAVLGDVRFRLNGKSHFPTFSPDGKTIAAESGSEAFLFDAASGRLLRRYPGRIGDKVSSLAFSPDGTKLAMGELRNIRLVDVRTGDVLHDLPEHTDWLAGIAFTPDSKTLVSCALDKTVRVYDVEKGRQTRVIACDAWLFSVAVMPDGKRVVAAPLTAASAAGRSRRGRRSSSRTTAIVGLRR